MKVLRPHDWFQIVLPVHTETMKTTEKAFNLLLRMCRIYEIYQYTNKNIKINKNTRYQLKQQYVLCRYPPSLFFK